MLPDCFRPCMPRSGRSSTWKRLLVSSLMAIFCLQIHAQQAEDKDRLGMAIEYFQGGKYHEALLIFQDLDRKYNLNPRFRGYIGVCCYYEWKYEEACKYLDALIPELEIFAPHERSVYYFSAANSHFQLKEYREAIPLYEKMLTVCYDNEKPETFYQLGFCYMFINDWHNARDSFASALAYYTRFLNRPDQQARMQQIRNMIKGCDERIAREPSPPAPPSHDAR